GQVSPAKPRPVPGRPADHAQVSLAERTGVAALHDEIVVVAEHRKRRVRRLWERALEIAAGAIAGGEVYETFAVIAAFAAWPRFEDENGQPGLHCFVCDHRPANARADHHDIR